MLALTARIRYQIDPANEYPGNFTGHLRASLIDGTVKELRQPHCERNTSGRAGWRSLEESDIGADGARDPFPPEELRAKFADNARYGG